MSAQFRHGVIICSCGYRTVRCSCCPDKQTFKANICLSCQAAMQQPNIVSKAISALTAEAERLYGTGRHLYPNDPINNRAGYAMVPRVFLEANDKESILLQVGCDWYYWARRADYAHWRELDNWEPWRMGAEQKCHDCQQPTRTGYISLPLGVLLCDACYPELCLAKEAQCSKTELSSGG